MAVCPICQNDDLDFQDLENNIVEIDCEYCGKYRMADIDCDVFANAKPKWKLSAAIRENTERGKIISVSSDNYKSIIESIYFPKSPREFVDELLLYMKAKANNFSEIVDLDHSVCVYIKAENMEILDKTIEYAIKLNYIEQITDFGYQFEIAGWDRLSELEAVNKDSKKVFVAMCFDKKMDLSWTQGFKPAIESFGYVAVRIDKEQHNTDITLELIKRIDQSRFLIADLTGDRGGVYYEAGYARGIKLPVIYTCREDWFNDHKPHFDVNHFPFIVWENEEELRTELIKRIKETIL